MKRLILTFLGLAFVITTLCSPEGLAAQHRRVVVRRPVVHTRLVVRTDHPIRRALPAAVIVRPARTAVIVGAPLLFLPVLAWAPTVVAMPARERLVWQESEVIESDEGWVDTNFG